MQWVIFKSRAFRNILCFLKRNLDGKNVGFLLLHADNNVEKESTDAKYTHAPKGARGRQAAKWSMEQPFLRKYSLKVAFRIAFDAL